jgi:predicted cupin superfamily sugar epimerase
MLSDLRPSARARALIESLALSPHPEGGYYREIYRSPALTTIYFLLVAPGRSAWHRVASSDEAWHFYDGDPLELSTIDPVTLVLHRVVLDRDHPAHVVPENWWQAARTLGEFSFVGCTVAPPFEFERFELLSDVPAEMKRLEKLITFEDASA